MYFFLPDAKDGLPALVEKVCSESGFLDRHLPKKHKKVGDFMIPKFKISFGFPVSDILKELGLVLLFSDHADLTEMVGQDYSVSDMFHQSFIEVDEQGTKAAAVTARKSTGCGFPIKEDTIDFVADHPFLFMIRENTTGTVLFIGYVLNPFDSGATSSIGSSLPSKGKRKGKDLNNKKKKKNARNITN